MTGPNLPCRRGKAYAKPPDEEVLSSLCRTLCPTGISPINPIEKIGHLRRRDLNRFPRSARGPDELPCLEPLHIQGHSDPIMPYQFHQIAAASPEAEYLPGVWVPPKPLLNLKCQGAHAAPHVGDAACDPDFHSRRKRDHRPSTTERSRASASGSTLAGTTSWRPFLRAISTRASGFGGTGLGDIVPGNSAPGAVQISLVSCLMFIVR